jgi:hypothetical protein
VITALRISQDFTHVRAAGEQRPVATHISWDVDYTVLYPALGESADYTETRSTRKDALTRAIELLQEDLEDE